MAPEKLSETIKVGRLGPIGVWSLKVGSQHTKDMKVVSDHGWASRKHWLASIGENKWSPRDPEYKFNVTTHENAKMTRGKQAKDKMFEAIQHTIDENPDWFLTGDQEDIEQIISAGMVDYLASADHEKAEGIVSEVSAHKLFKNIMKNLWSEGHLQTISRLPNLMRNITS